MGCPRTGACIALTLVLLCGATGAGAQGVLEGTEVIDFDRPEAWALKYFASASLLTDLGPPRALEPGQVELALELVWIPSLSEEQRRVGFYGTKVEDLNRSPVLPRPRLIVGLPAKLTLEVAWVPPVEIDRVRSNLLSLAIARPIVDRERWVLGVRAYGQIGESEGDFTCPEDEASIEPGEPGNEFGCEEPSEDTVTLNYLGLGLTGGYRLSSPRDAAFHLGVYANYLDLEFQVDALTFGFRDRTRLVTDGFTFSVSGGFSWEALKNTRLAIEAFYSPLQVQRSPDGSTDNDPLFNIRAMIGYRFR